MQAQKRGHPASVPVFHVNRGANQLIRNEIDAKRLSAMPVGNLESDVSVTMRGNCVVLNLFVPSLQDTRTCRVPSTAGMSENAMLCAYFETVLGELGHELHLFEVIDNDRDTPNTFLGTACIAYPGEALLPWNGYVWEIPSEIKQNKTVIAPVANCENADQESHARYAWNWIVRDFSRQKKITNDAKEILEKFSEDAVVERQPFTYIANFPGFFLVGDVITSLTSTTLPVDICRIYHAEVLRFVSKRHADTPGTAGVNFSTREDLYLYLQLLQFSISRIYRQAGVSPYRLEQGEDQGPIFRPGVFGVRDDCEGLMTFFLDVFRSIQTHGLLQEFLQQDLMPLDYNGVFVEPGRVVYANQVHACTVVLVIDHEGRPELGVVENTFPVFFLESDAVAQKWKNYLLSILKKYEKKTVNAGHRDEEWFGCTDKKKAANEYEIAWFGNYLAFTLEVDNGSVQFQHGAVPWKRYTRFLQCTKNVQWLQQNISKQAALPNTTTLVLLSASVFFCSYRFFSTLVGKEDDFFDEERHQAVIDYIQTATTLNAKLTKVHKENTDVIWDFQRDLLQLMHQNAENADSMQTDVRYLLSPASIKVNEMGEERLLLIVKKRVYVLCRLAEKARCIFYNYMKQAEMGSAPSLCPCLFQTLKHILQVLESFRQSWLWTHFECCAEELAHNMRALLPEACVLEYAHCESLLQILVNVSNVCYAILHE